MSTVRCVFCASLAAILATVIMVFFPPNTTKPDLLLGVCVLSARSNHEQREIIRNTWMTLAKNDDVSKKTVVKFVVGKHACTTHPHYRVDEFGCEEWLMDPDVDFNLDFTKDFEAFTIGEQSDSDYSSDDEVTKSKNSDSSNEKATSNSETGSKNSESPTSNARASKARSNSKTGSTYSEPPTSNLKTSQASSVSKTKIKTKTGPVAESLSVKILHDVVIKRLGILAIVKLTDKPIAVSLFKDAEEYEVTSVEFSLSDPGVIHKGYRYQPITPMTFTKGSELEISLSESGDISSEMSHKVLFPLPDDVSVVESLTLASHNSKTVNHNVHQEISPGVVVQGLREDGTTIKQKNNSLFSYLSFMYSVENPQKLIHHLESKAQKQREWKETTEKESPDLQREVDKFGDIILVDAVDVYRNLPSKLLRCHEWFAEKFSASHILKTDDDTFVALDKVTDVLSSQPLTGFQWWGNFRQGWEVQRTGKWREEDYPPSMYPPFACGSGYVVSQNVHDWLASNTRHLHRFQGEDVSMAIWLAPLSPKIMVDVRWQCFKTCSNDMLSLPDLTLEEMTALWGRRHGKLCS